MATNLATPHTEPFHNPTAAKYICPSPSNSDQILAFHKTLPAYARTPLTTLPASLSTNLGLDPSTTIQIKDESHRFNLPSFKILGASWAAHRSICKALDLAPSTDLSTVRAAAQRRPGSGDSQQPPSLRLVSCSDGNWGRALAHTAALLGVRATVYLPANINAATRALIASEGGADVRVVDGDYDASIAAAVADATAHKGQGALLVLDTSWDGYEEVPRWVTEGYESMLVEVDEALGAAVGASSSPRATNGEEQGGGVQRKQYRDPDLVIVSVGVGSWAHSVVSHYKSRLCSQVEDKSSAGRTLVVTVEADTAPSLLTSLHNNCIKSIATGNTIMCGMNCGTTSTIAWPLLRDGVDLALTISDLEAHEAVVELGKYGLQPGPCGAAPLAALKKIIRDDLLGPLGRRLEEGSRVVCFCTEGARDYEIPMNIF